MQIFKNVLNSETLAFISEERQRLHKEAVWRCSEHFWGNEIRVGNTGICLSTFVSEEARQRIKADITKYLPPHNDISAQHYIWHKYSSISTHNDWTYNFAITIYLNENWNQDYGGLFIWEDKVTGGMHALSPEYNTMVINSEKENHLVTAMSPLAPELRHTLQVWGN